MNNELVAILDTPKPSGMGMHGILLNTPAGLVTAGLRANRLVSTRELRELVDGGHVLIVDGELPDRLLGDQVRDAGVLWVGDEFAANADALGLAAPVPPREGKGLHPSGRFWFDLPSALFATTQNWLKNALRLLLTSDPPDLARLMVNADATSEFTRAALLHTSGEPERDLRWFLRLDADAGIISTVTSLRQRLDDLIRNASLADGSVVAVVAHAGQGSFAIGQEISSGSGAQFCAFRTYFTAEAERLFNSDTRKALVDTGEIVTTFRSADAIVEDAILQGLRPFARGVPPTLVDGLRHRHILHALQKAPSINVAIAAVTLDAQPADHDGDHSMTREQIERSETELEIDSLVRLASFELPRDSAAVKKILSTA